MKTIKTILILCVTLCFTTSCKKEVDMTLVQKTVFENANIYRINVDNGWEVTFIYDSLKSFVELEYSAYLEDYVSVSEANEWLKFDFNKQVYKQPGSVFRATVHISQNESLFIRADNASFITMEGIFEVEDMNIELHNASICNSFKVNSQLCDIDLTYGSQIYGVNFNGTNCSVNAHKGSSCKGYFNVEQSFAAGVAISSQLIVFGGSMPSASIEVKNEGTINMVQAEVNSMSVYLEDASEATVKVTETLSGFLLSGSTLYYKGNPQIDINCSDDSQIIPF
jgi:hypothetical protein